MKRSDVEQALAQELPHLLAILKEALEEGARREEAIGHISWAIVDFLERRGLMSPPSHEFWNIDDNGNLQQHHRNGDYIHSWERE